MNSKESDTDNYIKTTINPAFNNLIKQINENNNVTSKDIQAVKQIMIQAGADKNSADIKFLEDLQKEQKVKDQREEQLNNLIAKELKITSMKDKIQKGKLINEFKQNKKGKIFVKDFEKAYKLDKTNIKASKDMAGQLNEMRRNLLARYQPSKTKISENLNNTNIINSIINKMKTGKKWDDYSKEEQSALQAAGLDSKAKLAASTYSKIIDGEKKTFVRGLIPNYEAYKIECEKKGVKPLSKSEHQLSIEKDINDTLLKTLKMRFFSLYGYYPTHSTDMTWQNFCYQQVFSGNLSVSDLDGLINFNELQHHEEFANVKATIGTGVASAVAGGVGGMFLANKKIKAEEKRLGRPLTADEKAKIRNKYVATGAVGAGVLGAGAAHGIQVGADKGNATASNIVNKITAGRDKVTGAYNTAYNKGFEVYNKGRNKVERLMKKHLHGIDYDMQDKLAQHGADQQSDIQKAFEKRQKEGYDSLTYEEKQNLDKYYGQVTSGGLARKAKIVAGAGLAYKFLWPVVKDAMSSGAKVDTDAINAYVAKLKAEGKTEEEIEQEVRRYMNQAFFSSRLYR